MEGWFRGLPNKKPAMIFACAAAVARAAWKIAPLRYLLYSIGSVTSTLILFIAPALPFKQNYNYYFYNNRERLLTVYLITVFFCFVVTTILTVFVTHTWSGADPGRLYFSDDCHNILQYLLITPLCVTFSISVIVESKNIWWELRRLADITQSASEGTAGQNQPEEISIAANSRRFTAAIFLSLLITAIFIIPFIRDNLNPAVTGKLYWLANRTPSNDRVLNEAGIYYLLMNATFLVGACFSALAYLSVSIEIIRIGRNIEFLPNASALSDQEFSKLFSHFTVCYLLAKILVLLYAALIWSWGASEIGKSSNVDEATIILAIVAIAIVPFPRLYLEHKWWRFTKRDGARYNDIRNHPTIIISGLCNTIFYLLIFSLLKNHLHIPDILKLSKPILSTFE
jgi:hypothetical protein